jgi:hypothetical protein
MTTPARTARAALAAALVVTASGCDLVVRALLGASDAASPPPAAPASPAAPATSAAPTPAAAAAVTVTSQRYAGGRPIAWWSERLARLRRDGPEDLYRLTLERARLNGLEVVEREGGEVAVALAPAAPAGARP